MGHAFRRLVRAPAFSLTVLLTLGLAIGANALIFSVVNAVLLKPLPYADPDRLVGVWHTAPGLQVDALNQSPTTYFTYRDAGVFQDIGMWRNDAVSVTGRGEPEQVSILSVSDGTLPILGIRPALGRVFTPDDDAPGSADSVVLTHGYWMRVFNGRSDAVGQSLVIDGAPHEIIGVLPEGTRFLRGNPQLVLPFRFDRSEVYVGNFSYAALARLKPGGSIVQASADIARLIPGIPDRFPMAPGFTRAMFDDVKLGPNVRPLAQDVVGDIGNILWVLLATVAVVLLVACANIANLFLVRAEGRQQELAVRTALGASRTSVIGELLSEAWLLSLASGVLGLGLAFGGIRLLVALNPARLPRLDEIAIDPIVLLFTLGAAATSGLLFGLLPVIKYANPRLSMALKEGARGSSDGPERHRARNTLVVAQVAFTLVLLVASGLMVRTLLAMRDVSPGFTDPDRVLTMRISIPDAVIADPLAALDAHERIAARIRALPGVEVVGLSSAITLDGNHSSDPVWVEDQPLPEGQMAPLRRYRWISPDSFAAMGNRLIAGRDFTWDDIHARRPVAIISDGLAREFWGRPEAALGKRIRNSPRNQWREVVGVVGDERDDGVARPAPAVAYWPIAMNDFWDQDLFVSRYLSYAIRTPRVRGAGFLREVQQAVWDVNPNLPVARVAMLEEYYQQSLAETEFAVVILGIAAGVTLVLGLVGLYGLVAYTVAQRRREVGIRIALGAGAPSVQQMFVRQGASLAGLGLAVGLVVAFAVTRLMSALLFGVTAFDPLTYGAVVAALAAVTLAATWLPARRAARVDPADALRAE
ncbi:MAG: ABC transporter permease [Vicinamibacterales bacterium]